MARNQATPVTFDLTDGDTVSLITWDYVVNKLDEELSPMLDSIETINTYLTRIDTRIGTWLEENSN